MRAAAATASLVLGGILSGCSADNSSAEGDCAAQIRVDGEVYTSHSFTDRQATRHGTADRADCDDAGEDAAGSVFSDDPEQVTTWSFSGYPSDNVLGVRFDEDSFAVFVADSLPEEERERLSDELSKPAQ